MKSSLKTIVVTLISLSATLSSFSAARAQSGYDFLFWRFLSPAQAAPGPVHARAKDTHAAVSRHSDENVKYAPAMSIARTAYSSQFFGVGY